MGSRRRRRRREKGGEGGGGGGGGEGGGGVGRKRRRGGGGGELRGRRRCIHVYMYMYTGIIHRDGFSWSFFEIENQIHENVIRIEPP